MKKRQRNAIKAAMINLQRVKALEEILKGYPAHKINHGAISDIIARHTNEVTTLQQQVKEINSRLAALTNKYLELRDKPQANMLTVKKQPKDLPPTMTAHGSIDMLPKKPATNAKKEYKRIMKHGASVG